MKRWLAVMGAAVMLAGAAEAWRPAGWVYMDHPWVEEPATGDWYWFNVSDEQWVYGFAPADGWRRLADSALAAGWVYVDWPYAQCPADGAWYYLNEADAPWVVNMTTEAWSRLGTPTVPSSMVNISVQERTGMDPDFGAYTLNPAPFRMERHAVTKARWDETHAWALEHGYGFESSGPGKGPEHPVHSVNWHDSVKWCNARSEREGFAPVYYTDEAFTELYRTGQTDTVRVLATAGGYRLPTEEEWEYAARGGEENRRFPWAGSDEIQHARANYFSTTNDPYDTSATRGYHPDYSSGKAPFTSPVGSFAPNGYGLYDMAGNVGAWCFDFYLTFPAGELVRSTRGGASMDDASYLRVGRRRVLDPAEGGITIGIRPVMNGP